MNPALDGNTLCKKKLCENEQKGSRYKISRRLGLLFALMLEGNDDNFHSFYTVTQTAEQAHSSILAQRMEPSAQRERRAIAS